MRDVYIDELTYRMGEENVYYWRFGDLVLLRGLPWFDRPPIWTREDAIYNGECKIAAALSDDQAIDGVLYPAPAEAKRLKVELEPEIGPDTRFDPVGTRAWYGSGSRVRHSRRRFRRCRAAVGSFAP